MSAVVLSVRGISKSFGGVTALNNLSIEVGRGEIVGLMGPNGAGKSTLINVIAGECRPDHGSVHFKGHDITGLQPHQISRLGIARTYQVPQPFVSMTVYGNMRVASRFAGAATGRPGKSHASILDLLSLTEMMDAPAEQLPILALKKLEVARALAQAPELLLLDEVGAGTRDSDISKMAACIKEVRSWGITVIIIEHVFKLLYSVVDRIVAIDKGEKIAEGDPVSVLRDPGVTEAYFGADDQRPGEST